MIGRYTRVWRMGWSNAVDGARRSTRVELAGCDGQHDLCLSLQRLSQDMSPKTLVGTLFVFVKTVRLVCASSAKIKAS